MIDPDPGAERSRDPAPPRGGAGPAPADVPVAARESDRAWPWRPSSRILLFAACFAAALVLALWAQEASTLQRAPVRALFILAFAAALWVTEAIPAFAVGILVLGLQILLLGNPTTGIFATSDRDWEGFVDVLGHPLVWLFFGGFVMAEGMEVTRLDRALAVRVLGRFGSSPARLLAGVMGVTFGLSMFMSNTATTAMMLALVAPLVESRPAGDGTARALLLGVAVAANLGGMGSLIGTPPNAIAVGALGEVEGGPGVSFLSWLAVGLPPALLLLAGAWAAIQWRSDRGDAAFESPFPAAARAEEDPPVPPWQTRTVALTLLATVALWLGTGWHGAPTAAVSFLPIVVFTASGILGIERIRGLPYDVLFLLAGGLALGRVVTDTGLSAWLVASMPLEGMGLAGMAAVLALLTVALSNFMSNTAAANILVPIGVSMAAGASSDPAAAAQLVLPVALCASVAMCLPVATPPNALAYASGRLSAGDLLRMGAVVGAAGVGVTLAWCRWAVPWILGAGSPPAP